MGKVFGIIMIAIYLGMGILFLCGYFDILFPSWKWVKWAGAALFIGYGCWRAYRQFAGVDQNFGNDPDDDPDDDDPTAFGRHK